MSELNNKIELNPRDKSSEAMRKELAKLILKKSTSFCEDTLLLSPSNYTDKARWEAEKQKIFLETPLLACLTQDIPNAGDMLTFDAAGPSILVVRTQAGEVNAFLNMCMHRGARLVEGCKNAGRISCPFHAWTYDLEGDIVGIPRREAFDKEDLQGRELIRMPVGEWGGMIFVKGTPSDEAIDVKAHLGEFATIIELLELEKVGPAKAECLDVDANWKYTLDTYGEGYHVGVLHGSTVGDQFYGDINVHEQYGLHHRFCFGAKNVEPDTQNGMPDFSLALIYYIYPNVAINLFPISATEKLVNVNRIFPGDEVETSFSLMSAYKFGGQTTEEDLPVYQQYHDFIMQVVGTEDYKVAKEATNNMLHAPKEFKSVFGRNEIGAQSAQRKIAEAIGIPLE